MIITAKTKAIYASVVLLVQIYLVYAATLYVPLWSGGFFCVAIAAVVSAVGALYYIYVVAEKDQIVSYNQQFTLEERRRLG